jgi:DNA-binding HxlR family transcriptional regulator
MAARGCSIAGTLDVIGDRWSILILRDAFRGVRRFDELQRDLGIARNVLTDRLQKLVDHGVLTRVPYQARPTRYEYRLTPKGVDLSPALVALMRWGDRWLAGGEGPPLVLTHRSCGEPLDQAFVCWSCDTTVTPAQIGSRPGPGATRRGSQRAGAGQPA